MCVCVTLSGRADVSRRLPAGVLLPNRARGDGDHGERQQAPPRERHAASRRLLLHGQSRPQSSKYCTNMTE